MSFEGGCHCGSLRYRVDGPVKWGTYCHCRICQLTLGASVELDFSQPWHRTGPVFGDPRLAP